MQMEALDSFGTWLKEWRQRHDLTQAEIAREVGCSANLIHKIEVGTRRPSRDIATLLVARLSVAEADQPAFVRWARGGPTPVVLPAISTLPAPPAPPAPPIPAVGLPAPLTTWIG